MVTGPSRRVAAPDNQCSRRFLVTERWTASGVTCATSDELYNQGFDEFAGFPDTQDLGLIILDQAIVLDEYGQLAAVGTLDPLATQRGRQDLTITASGYGLTMSSPVAFESYRERLMASSRLTNLGSANTAGFNVQTNGNGKDKGGTCSGDSGGPVFHGGDLVADTSYGYTSNCRYLGGYQRVDVPVVRDWLLCTLGDDPVANCPTL